jgi:UDP-glucose 4-epimerase
LQPIHKKRREGRLHDEWKEPRKAEAQRSYFVVGGAGFIGSHFVERLRAESGTHKVTVFDNFSSGREWHIPEVKKSAPLEIIRADAGSLDILAEAMSGHDIVIHLASNPDIARAVREPEIDFYQGTMLTNNVVEAMRRACVSQLLYASGSGVYGEAGEQRLHEDYAPLKPVSTYGASKLAGEALIASYCAMFGLRACAFRFANVVGARQTHGVGFDFIRRLSIDPTRLRILGDGKQSKSYIHVSDVVEAVLQVCEKVSENLAVFNVSTDDAITVTEIAELAIECLGLKRTPWFEYTGGDRGWKGDVPVVRLDASRIRVLGWSPRYNSREAIQKSLEELLADERVLA